MVPATVAVLGAGNGGKAMAADLIRRGFPVRLYDRFPEALSDIRERGGIVLHSGTEECFAPVTAATADLGEAVRGADCVVIVVPAFAHGFLIDALLPLLVDGQTVLFTPGYLGSVLLRRRLQQERSDLRVVVAETGSLPYACRLIGPAEVGLRGIKIALDVAAIPAVDTELALQRLLPLFPILIAASNVLEVALGNPNPVHHVPTCLLNYGRMEAARTTQWHDFAEWVTPGIARVQRLVDAERLAVMKALGLPGMDQDAWARRVYGGKPKEPLTTKGAIPANALAVPDRYVTEDVPMGLVPLESLGWVTAVPTPVISLLITLASTLYATDYRKTGRHLAVFGWSGKTADEIVEQVR